MDPGREDVPPGGNFLPALVVLLKAPRPGEVKTRLARDLGAEAAAEVYRCFVADLAELIWRLEGVQPYLAYTPAEAESEVRGLVEEGTSREPVSRVFRFFPQKEGDLGERMAAAVEEVQGRNHPHVVLLGSDSPHLPPGRIAEALTAIQQADLVLGPATDGGYYLLATRRPLGDLLQGMVWSTAEVLAQTCQRAQKAGWATTLLPEWYDVDTLADLHRLYEDLQAWDGPPGTRPCPRTWDWLRTWRSAV